MNNNEIKYCIKVHCETIRNIGIQVCLPCTNYEKIKPIPRAIQVP